MFLSISCHRSSCRPLIDTWYLSADGIDEARQKGGFGDLTILGGETTAARRGPYLCHAIPNKKHLVVMFVLRREFTGNEYECGAVRPDGCIFQIIIFSTKKCSSGMNGLDSLNSDPIRSVIFKTRIHIKGFRNFKCILHQAQTWSRRLIHLDTKANTRPSIILSDSTAPSYKVSKKLSGFSSNPFCQQLLDINGSSKSSRGKSGSLSG